MDVTRPFRALQRFGSGFLNKFEVSQCPSPILQDIYFVDTPGVLSGEKQRIGLAYDFPTVIEWPLPAPTVFCCSLMRTSLIFPTSLRARLKC